jgi:tetratricopeptide (TPR) repeat protein
MSLRSNLVSLYRTVVVLMVVLTVATPAIAKKSKPAKDSFHIMIDPKAMGDESAPDGALWAVYAGARMMVLTARVEAEEKSGQKSFNDSGDDFEIELAGRQAMVESFAELKIDPDKPSNAYFVTLVKIANAGFLDEYVLAAFARPGWTIPASYVSAFNLPGFYAWLKQNPIGDDHPTLAFTAPPNGKKWPDMPGETLTDLAVFKTDAKSCPGTLKKAEADLLAWSKIATALQSYPIAAEKRSDFVTTLSSLIDSGQVTGQNVTWVSIRPAAIAFYAGYCAVELQDYDAAVAPLRMSIQMQPLWPQPKFELAQTLIRQKKLAEADEVVTNLISFTKDKCDLAHAYRKRGYIRFDQGLLAEARDAYKTSLKYEPGNKIAADELKLLNVEMEKYGSENPGMDYDPLPQGEQQKTTCR